MLNYDKDVVFPKNRVNSEIQRRMFPLISFTILLIISIKIYGKNNV
jgi:hypothetical protein